MSISGHDMWDFVGEREHPGGNVEVSKKKKKQKGGYKPEKEV